MSGNRFRCINQWYYNKHDLTNASNDAADEIIAQPDRHLLNQQDLFAAQGGFNTVGIALGATLFGTFAIFALAPRTASHFRNGQSGFLEWICLGTSAAFWYGSATFVGQRAFGEHQKVQNHWMAYAFVKSQNRFEGRRVLTNAPIF